MNLLKKLRFFFFKKKTQECKKPKKNKTRWSSSKSKKKSQVGRKTLKKKNAKVFVPPVIQNSVMLNSPLPEHEVLQNSAITSNNNKVRIPSQVKLVITGSVGAGKTTAIGSISDNTPLTTETKPTDETALLKETTTTSMDYGTFVHSLKSKIHLYGTPGQKRFSFMGAILTEGASGLIILINNNQNDPFDDLSFYLKHNAEFLNSNHAVIGITHYDVNNKHSISDYSQFISGLGMQWPIVSIDARKSADVLILINLVIDATFVEKTALKA